MGSSHLRVVMSVLVLCVVAIGCEPVNKLPSSQIGVLVNGDSLGVNQIAFASKVLAQGETKAGGEAARQALEQLVDQQLLMQQAVEKKLNSSPDVLLAIDAASRAILAQTYLRQVTSAVPKPSAQDVATFYANNPALYAERRLYRFNQVALIGSDETTKAVEKKFQELSMQTDKSAIMNQLVQWLQGQNIKFRAASATQAAEQLPVEALPKFHAMKEGDIIALPVQGGLLVAQLVASQKDPVNQERAKASIEERLYNRAQQEAIKVEVKRLRANAKIQYFGEYAQASSVDKPAEAAPADAVLKPAASKP